jgi:hypothetical protein
VHQLSCQQAVFRFLVGLGLQNDSSFSCGKVTSTCPTGQCTPVISRVVTDRRYPRVAVVASTCHRCEINGVCFFRRMRISTCRISWSR